MSSNTLEKKGLRSRRNNEETGYMKRERGRETGKYGSMEGIRSKFKITFEINQKCVNMWI